MQKAPKVDFEKVDKKMQEERLMEYLKKLKKKNR